MDEVRLRPKRHRLRFELLEYGSDAVGREIDRRASLRSLPRGEHADQQPCAAAVEKRHLGRCGKQEGDTERVAVEREACLEIIDGNRYLRDLRAGEIHHT